TISDEMAMETMRHLARGRHGDPQVVAGESGVAGLAALRAMRPGGEMARRLGLGPGSTVLLFGTEGATDPVIYARIVEESENRQ
ncbi:MAG TPA: hypothetical protein VML75_27230, partial [Kofleriaceae bacterium]|nr:hypothetical protein [Kofleriaceae bacterium]